MNNHPIKRLQELGDYLSGFNARCRQMRWFAALFHVGVCEDILADEKAVLQEASALAHKSESYDVEAERIIDDLINDLPKSKQGALRKAAALVRQSAEADHDLSEMVAVE